MPELIVLCGVSHAGKTTYAKQINKSNKYKIINTDNIRIKLHGDRKIKNDEPVVWKEFDKQKNDAINNHENVILDACHLSSQARWHAKKYINGYDTKIVVFNTSKKELKKRWKKENKRIDWKIIEDMYSNFSISKDKLQYEGFNNIIFI